MNRHCLWSLLSLLALGCRGGVTMPETSAEADAGSSRAYADIVTELRPGSCWCEPVVSVGFKFCRFIVLNRNRQEEVWRTRCRHNVFKLIGNLEAGKEPSHP